VSVAPAALEPTLPGRLRHGDPPVPPDKGGSSGLRPPLGGLRATLARARAASEGYQCSALISPMNTLVSSVNTKAWRKATNSSSSMIAVASTEDSAPTT
jgi:hypothetical protein